MADVATFVREARLSQGLTQSQLGRRLGITQAAIAKLEQPGANPTVATLEKVMQASGQRLELRGVEHRSSVDETLVASYVRLSPAERLRAFQSNHQSVARLRARAQGQEG